MKIFKVLIGILAISLTLSSCVVEVAEPQQHYDNTPSMSLYEKLQSYELWYVDINETTGYGEVPFLQKAFTLSFLNGTLYANNNLVGIGNTGNGFGIDVGYYNTYNTTLEVSHDIDGYWNMEVYQLASNKLELYHPPTNTSYFVYGYQRATFDYDLVFYDNIHYFIQEYESWEKVGTYGGSPTEFDAENFIQFLAGGNNSEFRSSQDVPGTPINNLYWDYTGLYEVYNFTNSNYVKALTLDYDYFDDEYFELSVINDGIIELYHPASGTVYEFIGRHYIQFLKGAEGKLKEKKRTKTALKNFKVPASNRNKLKK